jgi:type I restriction enzyme, S subunit
MICCSRTFAHGPPDPATEIAKADELKSLEVPVPSSNDQQRIAKRLRQADQLRRMRRYALQMSDEIPRAAFLKLFGRLIANPKQWHTVNLGQVILSGPQNGVYKSASNYGSGTPILRIEAFNDGRMSDPRAFKRLKLTDPEIASYMLKPNDLVINRVNSRSHLGKSLLIPKFHEPIVYESNMMRFAVDCNHVNPVFLIQQLQSDFLKRQIQTAAKDAVNQASINQQDVASFEIRLPPIRLQDRFASLVKHHEQLRATHVEALRQADHLFHTLLHQAFSDSE